MPRHRATAKNINKVVTAIAAQCKRPGDEGLFYRKFWAEGLNRLCDGAGDAFGTEGQDDPRGDQRD